MSNGGQTRTFQSMHGKICLITGATSGIGAATALELAQRGARIVLVGRSHKKSTITASQIRLHTGNPEIEFLLADLSSQRDIRQLAREYTSRHKRLDVLINNAGAMFARRQETIDGIEMTFALNHLAYFLLTGLLLETLKASAPARIINVSSFAHRLATLRFDNLQGQKGYIGWKAYSRSKLANLAFTYELARRLEGSGVTVNATDPGLVATQFGLRQSGIVGPIKRLLNIMTRDAKEGARTIVFLAACPSVGGITGQYFVNRKVVKSSRASYDTAAAGRLWRISAEMTGLPESIREKESHPCT
jgi:NAD(P)-dependent dehydrogenase (short-subunit alcohol dehydrogenase family)